MSKMYDLYMEYKDKEVDDNFIEQATQYILDKEKGLVPYVKNVNIEKDGDVTRPLGEYDNEKKEIMVNLGNIKDLHNNTLFNHQALATLQILRHEIEHANNLKKLYEYRDTIERLLIEFSLIDFCAEHNLLMHGYYNFDNKNDLLYVGNKMVNYELDPGERIADIRAWKYMVNLLKNQRTSDELLLCREFLYNAYCRGYNNNGYYIESPTYNYLIYLNQIPDYFYLKSRVENKDYIVDSRLFGGLPLRNSEFDSEIVKRAKNVKVLKQ